MVFSLRKFNLGRSGEHKGKPGTYRIYEQVSGTAHPSCRSDLGVLRGGSFISAF